MNGRSIGRAGILVDWRNLPGLSGLNPTGVPADRYIRDSLFAVQEQSAGLISRITGNLRYRCAMRIYNGWHVRRDPTPDRLNFERALQAEQGARFSRTIGRISFPGSPEFGDKLVHDEKYGTLFGTRRPQGQKMVDTAIIADALTLLTTNYADLVLIVSDDDDFVPALVSGEALGYSIYLLRKAGRDLSAVTDLEVCPGVKFWSNE